LAFERRAGCWSVVLRRRGAVITMLYLLDSPACPQTVCCDGSPPALRRPSALHRRMGVPLTFAGVLFPGSAWFGIAAVAVLPALLIHSKTRSVALLTAATVSIILNAGTKPINIPKGWEAEATRIHRSRQQDSLTDFFIEDQLQRTVMQSHARVLVFPEGAVRHWTAATDAFWAPALGGTSKTVLIGAGQAIPGSSQYYNSVVIVGKEQREAIHQRIPVPGGMWNPLRPKGTFAADLFAPGTVDIGGQRVAILICYEQLLT
jgi:apolipoprotein N-acyltransferase